MKTSLRKIHRTTMLRATFVLPMVLFAPLLSLLVVISARHFLKYTHRVPHILRRGNMGRLRPVPIATVMAASVPSLLFAQGSTAAPEINQADTAWMLTSTALVLLMTPALAFFYGGLVGSKNVLNTMMMSFIALAFIGVLWAVVAYSLAFSTGNDWIGDTSFLFLQGVGLEAKGAPVLIPHLLYMAYQATFAIIT